MQRLEAKAYHVRTYYYLPQCGWKNAKCRRLSQKYLGNLEDLAQAVQGTGPAPEYAVVLDWGLPQALWREADRAQVVEHVNQLGPKRAQGLSTGDYVRLAAINRAYDPVSKQAMWDWLTALAWCGCGPRLRRRSSLPSASGITWTESSPPRPRRSGSNSSRQSCSES